MDERGQRTQEKFNNLDFKQQKQVLNKAYEIREENDGDIDYQDSKEQAMESFSSKKEEESLTK